MEDKRLKLLEIVGTASERAGAFAGKAATIGDKITGFATGSVSAGKEMLGLADKKVKRPSEKKSDNSKTSTLKSDLAAARRKLTKAEKTPSKLKSQLKELKIENHSLVSELDQMRSELSETKSREGAVRARATALESELDDTRRELEEVQSKSSQTDTRQGSQSEGVTALKSDLAATQSKLDKMRDEVKKTKSQFESRLKEMQAKKDTLLSELEKTQRQAEKVQSELASELKDLRVEKESLISDLEKSRSKVSEMTSREEQVNGQAAKLESQLATARQELAETQSQAEYAQTQLNKQLRDLPAENKSLISELEEARKEADDERLRADSMEAQIAALESNVAAVSLKSTETCEEESDIDIGSPQTDYQEKPAIMTGEEIKPSNETVVIQDEAQIDADVENVEEPEQELELESEAEIDVEEIEPEPIPEVELTEPVEVTSEDVQAADFKNEAERIIFTKALSDFASHDIAARVDAARAIGGIAHELSARVLVAHITDEPSAVVRQECIKVLITLEMVEGLSAVESALTDETASARLAAVWGIYRLAGVKSLPKLMRMLGDNDESVRRRAVTCIGWLGGQLETIGDFQLRRVISALIKRLDDPADSIRKATLDALQAVTGKRIAEPISAGQAASYKRPIEQWRNWWKAELLGQRWI